jgi:hypothetical protein
MQTNQQTRLSSKEERQKSKQERLRSRVKTASNPTRKRTDEMTLNIVFIKDEIRLFLA